MYFAHAICRQASSSTFGRNCLTAPDAVFVGRTAIGEDALAFVVRIFSAYNDVVILRIFDTAFGVDGDQSPRSFDLDRKSVV